ncbi:MAG: hypothetical protein IPP25_17735 [Saprospiraceae bacterium]|nr:hypothetical protein [Candidatus Opimibacter skivensis]
MQLIIELYFVRQVTEYDYFHPFKPIPALHPDSNITSSSNNQPGMKWFAPALFSALLLMPLLGKAQINDCASAVVVCTSESLTFNPNGPGYDDYADPDNDPGCITALEQNSAWYYFQIDPSAPPGLELGFIIAPNGGLGEDYDWALYGPGVNCGDLGSPIRCSSSSAACGFCPETGMGMGTTDITEGPGTGDGFVMTLIVEPGQGYYLMVDNWLGTSNGFVLTWTGAAAPTSIAMPIPPARSLRLLDQIFLPAKVMKIFPWMEVLLVTTVVKHSLGLELMVEPDFSAILISQALRLIYLQDSAEPSCIH